MADLLPKKTHHTEQKTHTERTKANWTHWKESGTKNTHTHTHGMRNAVPFTGKERQSQKDSRARDNRGYMDGQNNRHTNNI